MNPVKNVITGIPDTNIGAPPGQEDEVSPLPAAIGESSLGLPLIVSRWRPTPEERALLASGGDVYLTAYSPVMIPVMMTADPPIVARYGPGCCILTPDHPAYEILTNPPAIDA